MSGAWEILEANQVLIGLLHTDITSIAWSFGLRNLIVPGREELRRFNPFMPVAGMPYDHARNVVSQKALEFNAEWVFFLDTDVIPPKDALVRLLAHRQPFISGMYCRRSPPHSVPVAIKDGQWLTNFKPGSVVEVDVVGAGCLLIHRSVFEKLPPQRPGKPWFDWRVDMVGLLPQSECMSEDFTLCSHYRKHGGHVLVDTSIQCKHVGLCQAGYGTLYPCETTPIT